MVKFQQKLTARRVRFAICRFNNESQWIERISCAKNGYGPSRGRCLQYRSVRLVSDGLIVFHNADGDALIATRTSGVL